MGGVSLVEGRSHSSRKIVEDAYGDLCEEGKDIHVIQWARNSPDIRMRGLFPFFGFGWAKNSDLDFEDFRGQTVG